MKIILVWLALLGATYAHLPVEEVEKRCLVDKPDVSQGVAYVADSDCAFYWQCDFAYTVLKNVTLKKCPIGTLWLTTGILESPPAPGQEPVICVNCELQPNPVCRVKYPLGSKQCPYAPPPVPTTTEKTPPFGQKRCTLRPQNLEFQEIVGEVSKVWFLGANQTYDCGHLLFSFDKCGCVAAEEFPIFWNFVVNLNSYGNRIYAANEPVDTVKLSGDGCAVFNGSGGLQIPYFKNMRPRTSWVTAVVFNRPKEQYATILYQCNTIFINGDAVTAAVVVQNPLGEKQTLNVSVTAPGEGYVLVIVTWNGKTLNLTVYVGHNVYQNSNEIPYDPAYDSIWTIVTLPQQSMSVGYTPRPDVDGPWPWPWPWPWPPEPPGPPGPWADPPGSFSGNVCLLFFTDKLYPNADSVKADILLDYSGPEFG